jgi:putative colanic acid biosynthesis acetyltransferase WcaF
LIQDLSRFRLPPGFRGRSPAAVQLWWFVQATFFRRSPQFAYAFRNWILRCFGAQIGKGAIIRPSVTITYPWKINIGDHVWIGDDVVLYSLGPIVIESHAVISQRSYLCTGDHDYTMPDFPIRSRKITIGSEAWIATDVFIAPGVTIGKESVIGARSSVFSDIPAGMVCLGHPCKPIKKRSFTS